MRSKCLEIDVDKLFIITYTPQEMALHWGSALSMRVVPDMRRSGRNDPGFGNELLDSDE